MKGVVLFKTHFWDDFCQRSWEACVNASGPLDVVILLDISRGAIEIPRGANVYTFSEAQARARGLFHPNPYNIFWYNVDYPMYIFYDDRPQYDFYLMIEYDVRTTVDILKVISSMQEREIDHVSQIGCSRHEDWYWSSTCDNFYPGLSILPNALLCCSAYSRRALQQLHKRRLEQAEIYQKNGLTKWPFCEAYVPLELDRAGMKMVQMAEFGDTSEFIWWPPKLESTIELSPSTPSFVHPVLDEDRYVDSLLRYGHQLISYFKPGSMLRSKLELLPPEAYVKKLAQALRSHGHDEEARALEMA